MAKRFRYRTRYVSRPRRSRRFFGRFRRRRGKKAGLSLITAAAVGAAEWQAIAPSLNYFKNNDFENGVKSLAQEHVFTWTGVNPGMFGTPNYTPNFQRLAQTYAPIIIAGLASKYLGRYVNPTIKRIPMIGGKLRL